MLKKLPKVRSKWPKEAKLTKNTKFNLFDGDRLVGMLELNAGTTVKVIEIKTEHAIVKIATGESPLPVANTDIIERMGGEEKILAFPDDPLPEVERPKEKQPEAKKS